jgi:hypothetical protein
MVNHVLPAQGLRVEPQPDLAALNDLVSACQRAATAHDGLAPLVNTGLALVMRHADTERWRWFLDTVDLAGLNPEPSWGWVDACALRMPVAPTTRRACGHRRRIISMMTSWSLPWSTERETWAVKMAARLGSDSAGMITRAVLTQQRQPGWCLGDAVLRAGPQARIHRLHQPARDLLLELLREHGRQEGRAAERARLALHRYSVGSAGDSG